MKTKNAPLLIVAAVVVIGIIGAVVYGINQNHKSNNPTIQQPNSPDNKPVDTSNAKETNSVTISNFSFTSATIKVKVGTKVTWTNMDSVQHNVVGDNLKELSGPLLDKGKSYSYTFDKAGTFSYHCMPHPYMKGTVVVTQ